MWSTVATVRSGQRTVSPLSFNAEKPLGLVHLALAGPDGCEAWVQHFGERRGREAIQKMSVIRGLDRLRLCLLAQD